MDVGVQSLRVGSDGASKILLGRYDQSRVFRLYETLQVQHSEIVQEQRMIRYDAYRCKMESFGSGEVIVVISLVATIVVIQTKTRNRNGKSVNDDDESAGGSDLRP